MDIAQRKVVVDRRLKQDGIRTIDQEVVSLIRQYPRSRIPAMATPDAIGTQISPWQAPAPEETITTRYPRLHRQYDQTFRKGHVPSAALIFFIVRLLTQPVAVGAFDASSRLSSPHRSCGNLPSVCGN